MAQRTKAERGKATGLHVRRHFTRPGENPFETVAWRRVDAKIVGADGREVFHQEGVEAPSGWSDHAVRVVASKYFFGKLGTHERESSVRQLVHRVARTIADWGIEDGYFASADDGQAFYDELVYLALHQYGAFNSPVWFNVGLFPE